MKHLKIELNKGQYSPDGVAWFDIENINKVDLLKIIGFALMDDFTMDAYISESLPNPAQNIIYRNLYNKLFELNSNKERFRDESQQLYREALQKYKALQETS